MPRNEDRKFNWWIGGLLIAAVVVFAVGWFRSGITLAEVTDAIAGLNAALVLLLMATLPIGGFSIGIVYVVAGIKFGPLLGGVAVAAATAVHLLGSHWVGRTVLREPVQRFIKRRRHSLPEIPPGENVSISAMAALIPGLPYVARNYLLAISKVPLRVYFWVCLPIYVIRSYVAIMIGDIGTDLSAKTITILVSVYGVKLGICAYLIWRIRKKFKLEKRSRPGSKRVSV